MNDTLRCRRCVFENSAATALIAASIPPIPRPVTTRQIDRSTRPVTVVAISMPVAMTARQPRIVGRRPILSATPPRTIEPIAMPISSIDSTMPRAARSMPHSVAMPGEAKLMERMSKPSSAFSAIVIPTTMICRRPMGDCAITSLGSLFIRRSVSLPVLPSATTARMCAREELTPWHYIRNARRSWINSPRWAARRCTK